MSKEVWLIGFTLLAIFVVLIRTAQLTDTIVDKDAKIKQAIETIEKQQKLLDDKDLVIKIQAEKLRVYEGK